MSARWKLRTPAKSSTRKTSCTSRLRQVSRKGRHAILRKNRNSTTELWKSNNFMTDEPLIEVKNLTKYFPAGEGLFGKGTGVVKALDDVSFSIRKGETF